MSVSVGVCSNALATRSRLSKRTESHSREHLWSLPASLLFFFYPPPSSSLSPPAPPPLSFSSSPRSRWPSVLSLTCSLTYGSSADRSGSTGLFKGISTIFDSGFHTRRDLVTTRGRSENYDASRRCDTQARCEKIRGTTNYGSSFGETFCAYR